MVSCIENEGFENDAYWSTNTAQGGVADRHVVGGHTGGREGQSDTTAPTGVNCRATLYKDPTTLKPKIGHFSSIDGTIAWWIKIVAEALNGWLSFEIRVGTFDTVDNRFLVYFHHAVGIAVPPDGPLWKYIDMGTAKPVAWTQFTRNLRADYFGKFGSLTHPIKQIQYYGAGRNAPDTRGQDLRIDDVVLDTLSSRGSNPGRAGTSINTPSQEV